MNIDISTLFPDLEALTPDGRWAMLQQWLRENPEYAERAERWSKQTVDQVFDELLVLASKKHGTMAAVAFSLPVIAAKIKSSIEVLQACYRERAGINNQTEKEIKNARRQIKPSKKPGRAKPVKRTGQDRD
jgi:hypothetical protein